MCPPASTPPLTGDACGLPSARSVMSSMRWRGRTNSSSSSTPTSVFVAMFGAMASRLATARDDLSPDPDALDPGGADLVGGVEGVAVEEDEVRDRAGLDHPGVVAVAHPGRAGGVRREGDLEGQGLVGEERLAPGTPGFPVRHPVDGDVDRLERVRGADRPVAAGDEAGAGAVEVAEGVLARRPLPAEERDGEVDHLVVVAGPELLDVGRDLQLGEPRHVD